MGPPHHDPQAMELGESTRLDLERAENADDDTRLTVLEELYETLEAELAEDAPARP